MHTYDSNIVRVSDGLKPEGFLSLQSILNATSARSSIVVAARSWNWHWYYVFCLLFVYQIVAILWRFWWKAPIRMVPSRRVLTNLYRKTLLLLLIQQPWEGG